MPSPVVGKQVPEIEKQPAVMFTPFAMVVEPVLETEKMDVFVVPPEFVDEEIVNRLVVDAP